MSLLFRRFRSLIRRGPRSRGAAFALVGMLEAARCIVIPDRASARFYMARPEEWCPVCQDGAEKRATEQKTD